jgi:hypothetical protein
MPARKTSKLATNLGHKAAFVVLALPVLILLYVEFWGLTPQLVKAIYIGVAVLCCGLIVMGLFLFYLKRRKARQK